MKEIKKELQEFKSKNEIENRKSIPVNHIGEEFGHGISLERITEENYSSSGEAGHPHRHDYHIFLLAQKGSVDFEIDFESHTITAPSILYIHPNQVHRIRNAHQADFHLIGMDSDSLNTIYLEYLEQSHLSIQPITLEQEDFLFFKSMLEQCIRASKCKKDKVYAEILNDCYNAFAGLVIGQYMQHTEPITIITRAEIINRNFRTTLEKNFKNIKRPAGYAGLLNISTSYLNECVSQVTGYSVSHHILQRVMLEARRLLYHSDQSIKEISIALGYEDPDYFSRSFKKIVGVSPIAFKNKILD
ncbi:AraC family transcriptional regulator [Flavobacterium sp. '19STA2R22 D10 B1']|uniref:AraC family transcriptional regulator n=1 Tax=Flavobacterium aerium TaxID=3037261 RepID=UPI00278BBEBB|nr:helix-turn-helix transcriptional regulator [Flavobacterium sp. '19STA2R22 D10 B1']